MKKLIYFLALLPMTTFALASNAQGTSNNELNKESVNYHATADEKAKLPNTIIIKKDQDGKISVYKAIGKVDKPTANNADQLEKLPFEKVENLKGLKMAELTASVNELDNDQPRQSWYWWYGGFTYGYGWYNAYYYYPVYYYNYAYYPYYYYGYRGCSYYYYGCGYGYC